MDDMCEWTEDEDGCWNSACGRKFEYIEGTPRENSVRYCPYCGKSLREIRYHE